MTGLGLELPPRFTAGRALAVALGLAAVLVGWARVGTAADGVTTDRILVGHVPVTLHSPVGVERSAGIVLVHGFAGNGDLLRSFGLSFARNGTVVAVPDLAGHADNRAPFDEGAVIGEVSSVLEHLASLETVDASRLGLLGHARGVDPVLAVAAAQPRLVRAVIAVSPDVAGGPQGDVGAGRGVRDDQHVLVVAGSREPRAVATGRALVERGEGTSGVSVPTAERDVLERGGVEHVLVPFDGEAHRATVEWFEQVTAAGAAPPGQHRSATQPLAWWLLGLVGTVLAWRACAPLLVTHEVVERRRGHPVIGCVVGCVAATLALAVAASFADLRGVGGMHVAPVLVAWFAVSGGVWLRFGDGTGAPDTRDPGWGLVGLGVLVVAFGALAEQVWLPWFTGGPRAWYALLFAVGLLPWTLAFGATMQDRRGVRGVGAWITVSAVLLLTLGAARESLDGLERTGIVLPLLPAGLGLAAVVTATLQRPWAAGFATAGFLGWMLAVLFPLA